MALKFEGDVTGGEARYVVFEDDVATVHNQWSKVTADRMALDESSIFMLLRLGFVPPPFTLFRNVYQLAPGDMLNGNAQGLTYCCDLPYLSRCSREDSEPSVERLEQLLVDAMKRSVKPGNDNYLMLSAGKDSTALLLAASLGGVRNLRTLTFESAGSEKEEWKIAQQLARRFGFDHEVIGTDAGRQWDLLEQCVDTTGSLTGDFALPAYLECVSAIREPRARIIDGLGVDLYMGAPLSSHLRWLSAIQSGAGSSKLWGRWELNRGRYEIAYLFETLLMRFPERLFPATRLSVPRIEALGFSSSRWKAYASHIESRTSPLDRHDKRAYVLRLFETASAMEKARLASDCFGHEVMFPFTDAQLIDYYFNLPRSERFDAKAGVNKLLLRQLLRKHLGELPFYAAKGSFRSPTVEFVTANSTRITRLAASFNGVPGLGRYVEKLQSRSGNKAAASRLYLLVVALLVLRKHGFKKVAEMPATKISFL